jgi:hypothetical protein
VDINMVNREIRQAASMDKGVTDTVNVSDTAGPPNTPFIIGLINQKVTANPPRPHKTPGRYVGIEEKADDGEPFDEKMTRLTGELAEMFAKRKSLEDEIRKRLGAIGYDF